MTAQPPSVLYGYFSAGDRPTQQNYTDLIDSSINQLATTAQIITSDVSALSKLDINGALTVKASSLTNLTGNITIGGLATVSAGLNVLASAPTSLTGNTTVSGRTVLSQRATINTQGQSSSGSIGTLSIKQISLDKTILINGVDAIYTTMEFQTNTSAVAGFIQVSGNTTNYVTTSDERLKTSVEPLRGNGSQIDNLIPVSYRWKESGKQGHGFIAQQVEKIIPEAVSRSGDAIGIDLSKIVPYLVAKTQDLEKRLSTLENKKE